MRLQSVLAGLCAFSVVVAASVCVAAESKAGREVAELLREAAREGIQIVFSDRLVPPGLKVRSEPAATETVASLREILAAHGLGLDEVAPGTYVVTRERASSESPPPTPAPPEVQEIHVVASRYTLEVPRADEAFRVGSDALRRQPVLFDDATRSVRRFPGTSGNGFSSRTFVRGGAADENLMLLDGMPLENPFHLQGLPADLSLIDPAVLDRVEFYSGVLPVEHAGRMGGLLDMHTRERAEDPGGRLALGFVNASALLEAPLPNHRGDALVFARRGMLDQVVRVVDREFGEPTFFDAFARMRYDLSSASTVTFSVLAAGDDIDLADEDEAEVMSGESDRRYFWLTYDKRWQRIHARTLLAHTSSTEDRSGERRQSVGEFGFVRDVRQTHLTLLKQDWQWQPDGDSTLRWGAALSRDKADYAYFLDVAFPAEAAELFGRPAASRSGISTSVTLDEYEAYVGLSRPLVSGLALDAGLHWTQAKYSTGQDDSRIDPRIGLLYTFAPRTRLRLSWGEMTQTWAASELPVEREQLQFDLRSRNKMYVLALEHQFASGGALRVEAYNKFIFRPRPRVENVLNPLVLVPELRVDRVIIDPDRTRVAGLDVYATGKVGPFEGWLSYSWSHARDEIDGREFARAWDQRHALGVGLGAEYRGWTLSGALTARSGWPVTRLVTSPEAPGVVIGERGSHSDAVFATLDLKAERRFDLGPGSLHIALELANATNRKNFCCSDLDFTRDASGNLIAREQRKFWLPVVPYASLAWEF